MKHTEIRDMNRQWREFRLEEKTNINEENESPWTWIYKGLLGGFKKAEKKGGNRVEEVAIAAAFLVKTEYGSGAKRDFLKEFNRRIK
jgi:hypothetical protein